MANKRSALVLSGGGAKGCWQAGVILKLHELGYRYDAYFGVSVGAINAAHMAQFAHGSELEGALNLKERWHQFSNKDIWRHHNRWLRWLAVPWKDSVYDAQPLRNFLHDPSNLDPARIRASGKHVEVGATDLTTGQYHLFDGHYDKFPEAVFASAAFPIMFSLGELDGHLLSDGGLVHVTPLKGAIEWGATHIDAIVLDPPGMKTWDLQPKWYEPKLVTHVVPRVLSTIVDNIIERDLRMCAQVNQRVKDGRGDPGQHYVNLRIIRPAEDLPIDSLDFDPAAMAKGWAMGYGIDIASV